MIITRVALIALALIAGSYVSVTSQPAYAETCPLMSESEISSAAGTALVVLPFDGAVTENGALTSCLFTGEVGFIIIVRLADEFPVGAPNMLTSAHLEQVKRGDDVVNYRPVSGVGDAAMWATAADPEVAKERMGFLLVKGGTSLFMLGSDDRDEAQAELTTSAIAIALIK